MNRMFLWQNAFFVSKARSIALLAVSTACLTECAPLPDRGVTLTYRLEGQCDALDALPSDPDPQDVIADVPGSAYLFIDIFQLENDRPDAVTFWLDKERLYVTGTQSAFDAVNWTTTPTPFQPGINWHTYMPFAALAPGLNQNPIHPSIEASTYNWQLNYRIDPNAPAGQGVILIKSPQGAGGQVQVFCRSINIPYPGP